MFYLTLSRSGISFASYFHKKYWITGFSVTYLMPVQGAVPKRTSQLPAAVGYNYTCWNLGKAKERAGIKNDRRKLCCSSFPSPDLAQFPLFIPPHLWLHKEHHSNSFQKKEQPHTSELFFLFPAYARNFPWHRLIGSRSNSFLVQLWKIPVLGEGELWGKK